MLKVFHTCLSSRRSFFLKEFKENNKINYHPIRWLLLIILSTIVVYLLKDILILYKALITLSLLILFIAYFMKNKKKSKSIYLKLDNGQMIKIQSIENYLEPEDEKYNKVFNDYAKISSDIPKA